MAVIPGSDIAEGKIRQLYDRIIEEPSEIIELLRRAQSEGLQLRGRRTAQGEAESASIIEVSSSSLIVKTEHVIADRGRHLLLSFDLGERLFLFGVAIEGADGAGNVRLSIPSAVYRAERRDRARAGSQVPGAPRAVRLQSEAGEASAVVADWSPTGLAVEIEKRKAEVLGDRLRVRYIDGNAAGSELWAAVKHSADVNTRPGWTRLGLAISEVPHSPPHAVEERPELLQLNAWEQLRSRWAVLSGGARVASSQTVQRLTGRKARLPRVELVDFVNRDGEPLRGIVDKTGSSRGGVAVVIPPAWGRTKETLLPLAATIVESFAKSGQAVTVLRFDGTRRRGESYNDPDCDQLGREHDRFTISGAVDDIHAAVRFVTKDENYRAARVVLVTFSAASIEGRRAVVEDNGDQIAGWVSVVGTPDLQSGMRTVSGGIDFFGGADRGARFGFQEIMGVRVDIDRVAKDALDARLVFLEDARRDMNRIRVPVTWIHGRNDAWLDLGRVREIMGCGEGASARRLISVPTGHQLRNSREALEVFRLVAKEVGRIATGREVRTALPDLHRLNKKRIAERRRRPQNQVDLRSFWRDYLVGRDGEFGIELMNATSAYRDLMEAQIAELDLRQGERVADLGCGTGAFELALAASGGWPEGLRIDALDFVGPAIRRARARLEEREPKRLADVAFVLADLDVSDSGATPLVAEGYDAVLASLLVSYVRRPEVLLRAARRLLKPGGRLVVSSLRLDADVSGLFVQGIEELRAGRARELFGSTVERRIEEAARSFLNDASRILDLEEDGAFKFWEPAEFERLVRRAGFEGVRSRLSFGAPPQAVVTFARKPAE